MTLWQEPVFAQDPLQCTGDCDANGSVGVDELLVGVQIALGELSSASCSGLDADRDQSVTVDEILTAVGAALGGCKHDPDSTPTASLVVPTPVPTATASPLPNRPPVIVLPELYRGVTGEEIRLPVLVEDPDGHAVACEVANLPLGAMYEDDRLVWTPEAEQAGAYLLSVRCSDDGNPPASTATAIGVEVREAERCGEALCAKDRGCTWSDKPIAVDCCSGGPRRRVPELVSTCLAGGSIAIGQNEAGFGELRTCDWLRISNFLQVGATVRFHLRASCLRFEEPVELEARLATASRVVFEDSRRVILRDRGVYGERLSIPFEVLGPGPFFEFEGAEAELVVQLQDADGRRLTERRRVRLTFERREDLPEIANVLLQ